MSPTRTDFSWQRIRDNVCLLQPGTIENINHLLIAAGHVLEPAAARTARADSFVIETNIHYPTESSLLVDGWEQLLKRALPLVEQYHIRGWRQHAYRLRNVRRIARNIQRIAAKKGPQYQQRLRAAYGKLLQQTRRLL